MNSRQCAPHLVQESPLIALLPSSPLAHQAKPDRKLRVLRIVEDAVLAEVFRLHHERRHHNELPGELIRQVELVTNVLLMILNQLLLLLCLLLLLFINFPLDLHVLEVIARLRRSNGIDVFLGKL